MEKKNKFIKIAGVVTAFIVVSAVLFIVLGNTADRYSKMYGTYEYINDEGQKSVIKIDKNRIYFDNLDYESCETAAAISKIAEEQFNSDEEDHVVSAEENKAMREEKISKLTSDWDFADTFDKKSCKYERILNDDNKDNILIIVSDKDDEYEVIEINFGINSGSCKLLASKLMEFYKI